MLDLVPIVCCLLSLAFPRTQEATLVFAGDAMQHKSQLDAARRGGGAYDYAGTLDAVRPLVEGADWAVVNLETTLPGKAYTGYPCFGSPDAWARHLRDTGFDMALTANNHCLDRGPSAVRRTLRVLDTLGLEHVGTYADASARRESLPAVTDVRGFRIGWLCYTYGTNGIEPRDGVAVDYIDTALIRRDIAATRAAGAEVMVVALHWGIEYQTRECEAQRRLARWLKDQRVDIIFGGHPHVVQPTRLEAGADGRTTLTIYSLGNLVSGMKTRDTRRGALMAVRLARREDGTPYVKAARQTDVAVGPGYRLKVTGSGDV